MSLDLNEDKSTLVQVMAWCHQTTSHYLSQCWPRSVSPSLDHNGLNMLWCASRQSKQGVNSLAPGICGSIFKRIIFKLIMQNSSLGIPQEIAFWWLPKCWPRFMSPYGITRPQCVNSTVFWYDYKGFQAAAMVFGFPNTWDVCQAINVKQVDLRWCYASTNNKLIQYKIICCMNSESGFINGRKYHCLSWYNCS